MYLENYALNVTQMHNFKVCKDLFFYKNIKL